VTVEQRLFPHKIAGMTGVRKLALVLALAVLLASGLVACGGGTSNDSTATTPEEGSAAFRTSTGDNSIQNFGDEANPEELEAAAASIGGYLRARAKDDWAMSCSYLSKTTVAPLEDFAARSSQIKGKGCAAILATLMARAPPRPGPTR
jgi:hypothetical protein